jgi:hypothetical protein
MVVSPTARGVEALLQPDVWIAETYVCRFFSATADRFLRDHHRSRREAIQRQGERVVALYGNRDRYRQECEEREGREAIAREVAERNRRNGWPY